MVTSYYIMNLNKTHKNLDLSGHIVLKNKSASNIKHSSCRVCLDEGCVSLLDINCNTLDTLQQLCKIQININDDLPKKLCNICYKFLKNTMVFINKAKETEELLKKSLHKKTKSEEGIHNNNSDLSEPEDYGLLNKNTECTAKMKLEFGKDSHVKEEKISSTMCDKKLNTKPTVAKRVQCKICKSVVMRSYFKQHMTMHDPNHSKYVCEICGKSYRLICAFYNHRFQHSTDFIHKCQLCPYKARDKALLRNHMKVHIADYKYMCNECPSRFLFRSNLNRHMWKHKEKQFSCDTCKRMFHTKLAVQKHHEVDHLGMKNHVCNLCGKAFGYRKAMMKHQRTVHKREKREYSRMPTYLQFENKK